jgi:hypothetical protein
MPWRPLEEKAVTELFEAFPDSKNLAAMAELIKINAKK